DICTGGGRARVQAAEMPAMPAPMAEAETPPWLPSYRWSDAHKRRKVVSGIDGLTEATAWNTGQRVCVYGGGGIGLNQIERAHDEAEAGKAVWIDWCSRDTLHASFNLRRNDMVLL